MAEKPNANTPEEQQRRDMELKEILAGIDTRAENKTLFPADIQKITKILEGTAVNKLIPSNMVISGVIQEITTKKGKKMFNIYDNGYGLTDVRDIQGRKLRVKVAVMLE